MIEPSVRALAVLYLSIVLVHSVLQERNRRRHAAAPRQRPGGPHWRSIDVVIPCYNEEPSLLAACCASLEAQDYPRELLHVHLVDDGSWNREALRGVYQRYEGRAGWTVQLPASNRGKRGAQDIAVRLGSGDLLVTIDSDTVLAPDGIRRLVGAFADEGVAAVTGHVRVINREQNQLTRLIDERYRLLFEHERAAQSQVGAVLCCSGAFSAYRRAALDKVWTDYQSQMFMGRRCVTGDDLHLTNLLLANGYRSKYEPTARADTTVPSTLRGYVRQQLRWNQSFYRELSLTLRVLPRQRPYIALDVTARLLQPLLLAAGLTLAGMQAVGGLGEPLRVLTAVGTVAIMCLSSVGSLTFKATASCRGRFMLLYGLIYVGLLIPTRLWALTTLYQNRWSTRHLPARRLARDQRRSRLTIRLRTCLAAITLPLRS
ncbi:MAG TPA: glycosyltransferase family 2 protein [Actinomycetes bacterium]|nr:glycosyltransferase family 2 protein [Actinomycetes bacterium]